MIMLIVSIDFVSEKKDDLVSLSSTFQTETPNGAVLFGAVSRQCGERWPRGRAPHCQSRGRCGSIPPTAVSKLMQFLHPTYACVFRKRH